MNKVKHIILPLDVWESKAIDMAEKFLYAEIASYASKGKECFMPNKAIADLLGCKERMARLHLNNLKKAGFITVEKFDGRRRKLQGRVVINCHADGQKNAVQSGNKMPHTIIYTSSDKSSEGIYKSTIQKEKIKKESFSFRSALIGIGVQPETADAWLLVRKNKRATNTQIAFDAIAKEIRKTGKSADECIRLAVIQSWAGFKAAWMEREQAGFQTAPRRENYVQAGLRVHDELLGTNFMEQYNKLKNGQ